MGGTVAGNQWRGMWQGRVVSRRRDCSRRRMTTPPVSALRTPMHRAYCGRSRSRRHRRSARFGQAAGARTTASTKASKPPFKPASTSPPPPWSEARIICGLSSERGLGARHASLRRSTTSIHSTPFGVSQPSGATRRMATATLPEAFWTRVRSDGGGGRRSRTAPRPTRLGLSASST